MEILFFISSVKIQGKNIYNKIDGFISPLVDHGADIEAENNAGQTPFYIACISSNNSKLVKELIKKGAVVKDEYAHVNRDHAVSPEARNQIIDNVISRNIQKKKRLETAVKKFENLAETKNSSERRVLRAKKKSSIAHE